MCLLGLVQRFLLDKSLLWRPQGIQMKAKANMIYKSVCSTDPWRSPQPIYTLTAAAEAEQAQQLQTQENHTASFQEIVVIYKMYSAFCSN